MNSCKAKRLLIIRCWKTLLGRVKKKTSAKERYAGKNLRIFDKGTKRIKLH